MKTTGGDFFGRHYFREEVGIHMKELKEFALRDNFSILFIWNKVKEIDKNARWLSGPISLLWALDLTMRNVHSAFILLQFLISGWMQLEEVCNITLSGTIVRYNVPLAQTIDLLEDHFHTLVHMFTGPKKTFSQPCNACTLALIFVLRGQSKLDLNRERRIRRTGSPI